MPLSTWWTVPQALVWISTGDESVIGVACADGASISLADIRASWAAADRQSPRNIGTWNAQEAFCEACAAGKISCRGRREGEGPADIPAEAWSHLTIHDADDHGPIRAAVKGDDSRTHWWVDLVVHAESIRNLWPVYPGVAENEDAPVDSTRRSSRESRDEGEPAVEYQDRFNAEKRRRMGEGEDHKYDAMTMWARHVLKVDTATANALWTHRSDEFARTQGRLKLTAKIPRKTRKMG
jgi:hypothetical protein